MIASDACDATTLSRIAPGAWIVVATQGRRDLQGLRLALALRARQVSFVASARKAKVLKDALLAAGCDAAAVGAIVAPAGYPIAATTPEEIALSVLAAVVANRRGAGVQAGNAAQQKVPGSAAAIREPAALMAPAGAAAPGEVLAPAAPTVPVASSCCGG